MTGRLYCIYEARRYYKKIINFINTNRTTVLCVVSCPLRQTCFEELCQRPACSDELESGGVVGAIQSVLRSLLAICYHYLPQRPFFYFSALTALNAIVDLCYLLDSYDSAWEVLSAQDPPDCVKARTPLALVVHVLYCSLKMHIIQELSLINVDFESVFIAH